ncbi:HPr family phosphocarrier protein [Methylophilaceae bacterium]|jgi:phosphocarrier protein HPr|nr:HPr family phosphocarrier protein [Methylophilaceae bacterium]|tara:strand:+ start:1002 stop:1271 length:270 start_codon:yes stop_codon:yes gene_type:complete
MIKKKLKIINKLGLHARASSKLTQLACSYTSEIFLIKDKNKVNAKSIMEVLMLAATKNTIILVMADGIDEKEAISDIEALFINYFGEGE